MDLIKADAAMFCSEEEALKVIKSIGARFNNVCLSEDLKELFELSVEERTEMAVPSPAAIGKWLDANKVDPPYFAEATKENRVVQKRVPKNMFSIAALGILGAGSDTDYRYVDETVTVVAGFRITMETPYIYVSVKAEPTLPNIQPAELFVVPVVSRTHLRLFWATAHYEYLDWTKRRQLGATSWSTDDAPLKDERLIEALVGAALASFVSSVEKPIRAKWERANPADAPQG